MNSSTRGREGQTCTTGNCCEGVRLHDKMQKREEVDYTV